MNANKVFEALQSVRQKSPLVHNITNYVVMNNTANALLSVGASPVMAHAVEEVEEMAGIASALVLNMGTLSERWIEAMILAGKKANERQIPIVFDPVGVGATTYRTNTANQIIELCKPTIIRGNASEIMALCNASVKTKGVDSTMNTSDALESAKLLAKETGAVVVISGNIDFVTDGEREATVSNGADMMAQVTGMGCTATAIIGAFAGAHNDLFEAATAAMVTMGICGQLARVKAEGPGSFQMHFLDALYMISEEDIQKKTILSA
jgi:hydroxyethylthiazole kinase